MNEGKLSPGNNTAGSTAFESKADFAANKFIELIVKNKVDLNTFYEEEAIELINSKSRLLFGSKPEEVLEVLKKREIVKPKKEIPTEIKEPEYIPTQYVKIEDEIKVVDDPKLIQRLEENRFFDELERNVFKNDKELDEIYNVAINLNVNENSQEFEGDEYYLKFINIVKGGKEEILADLAKLEACQRIFEEKNKQLSPDEQNRQEKSKKMATIVEKAIAYGITKLGWYGDNITMKPASKFDDVKRGVDDVIKIKREEDSSYLALGIDVTFNGLYSQKYKQKIFNLLKSIRENKKTKIKYHTDEDGELLKEFSIPKIVLHFDFNDVKDLIAIIKNKDNPQMLEKFANDTKKVRVMNQILVLCEELEKFAEESQNDIFKKYIDIISSIKELSWTNPKIREILDKRASDETSKQVKTLIQEFKTNEKHEKLLSDLEKQTSQGSAEMDFVDTFSEEEGSE